MDADSQRALARVLAAGLAAVGYELAHHAQEGGQGYYRTAGAAEAERMLVEAVGRIYAKDFIIRRIETAREPTVHLIRGEA